MCGSMVAQSDTRSASPKWERYLVGEKKMTALFPQLPITSNFRTLCSERDTKYYYAYARAVVYQFTIVAKSPVLTDERFVCKQTERLDEAMLAQRIAKLSVESGIRSS